MISKMVTVTHQTIWILCLTVFASSRIILTPSNKALQREFNLTDYVLQQGYPFEIHENIITEDGYLLDIYRLPEGRVARSAGKKPAVLLMHGLGAAADSWIISGPNHSLAFLLADKGYDVWLGNARGTSHSKKRVTINPDTNPAQFWNFSWHEIGYYDLYTTINYILNKTQQADLFYIGHSQGCTSYFVLESERPEMAKHVKLMIALAPAVFGDPRYVIKPQALAFDIFHQLDVLRLVLGVHTNDLSPQVKELACYSPVSNNLTCNAYFNMINSFFGFDPSSTHPEHWILIQQTIPDSSSAKQSFHYMQGTLTGDFRQYHLGRDENLKKYKSELPPLYNLTRINTPVALFWGENDMQAVPESVKKLSKLLPRVVEETEVPGYGHADFIAADSAVDVVYKEIFALMYNYAEF